MSWSIRSLFRRILTRRRKPVLRRTRFDLAELERKCVPAVTATFDNNLHSLAIVGTPAGDTCTISRDASGHILVNGQDTGAKLNQTDTITVALGDSQDNVTIDFTNGLFLQNNGGEVKFQVDGGGHDHDYFNIKGSKGDDHIDLGTMDGFGVVDFNADGDIDITLQNLEEFYIRGGDGNDEIDAGGNASIGFAFAFGLGLYGQAGNDTLTGGGNVNLFEGGQGNDTMNGGATLDKYMFSGGALGADTIVDTAGQNNALSFGNLSGLGIPNFAGPVVVDLRTTDAQVVHKQHLTLTMQGIDNVIGSEYADVVHGNNFGNVIDGRGGSDVIIGNGAGDIIFGGAGDDILDGDGQVESRLASDDSIEGGAGNDIILGKDGNDTLLGDSGNDNISGGTGDDEIAGGSGNDGITGNSGDDEIWGDSLGGGGFGNDSIDAGSGNDTVRGDAGDDSMQGGDGLD